MPFPRSSTALLSASVLLFVYWTTSAAQSHDPSLVDLSALRRFKKARDVTTEEQVQSGFKVGIDFMTMVTDVEWFNFASIYSGDETHILNAWMKLDELQQNLRLVTSEEEKLRLAEIFTNFCENSGTEGSVANIYHYLTVSGTSLNRNINSLLREKFKCSVSEMGRDTLYLSSLLWKSMVLNQLYWKLIGFEASRKQDKHNYVQEHLQSSERCVAVLSGKLSAVFG